MKKSITLALLSTLALYGSDGVKYGNLEVSKQYGKINADGYITNLSGNEPGQFNLPFRLGLNSPTLGSYK